MSGSVIIIFVLRDGWVQTPRRQPQGVASFNTRDSGIASALVYTRCQVDSFGTVAVNNRFHFLAVAVGALGAESSLSDSVRIRPRM